MKNLSDLKISIGLLLAYVVLSLLTQAHYQADSWIYVDQVQTAHESISTLWEFGHLIWRPVGYIVANILSIFPPSIAGASPRIELFNAFYFVCWLTGGLAVFSLYATLSTLVEQRWPAICVTLAFMLSHAFLNFSQTGSSYIPGLAFVLFSLYWQAMYYRSRRQYQLYASGISLAVAVVLWFLYLWVIPFVLGFGYLLWHGHREWKTQAITIGITAAVVISLSYSIVLISLGITDIVSVKQWIASSSHGVELSGVSRVVFGFARTFISMGQDGVLVKRYMLHDPFNPVSFQELFVTSLWRMLVFYSAFIIVVISVLRSRELRHVLWLFLVNAVPVLIFAALFDGGAIERYLPLYPGFFILITFAIAKLRPMRLNRYALAVTTIVMTVANWSVMSNATLRSQEEHVVAELRPLRTSLHPQDKIITLDLDDLLDFQRNFPNNPLNRDSLLHLHWLVELGASNVLDWRQDFADAVHSTWSAGGTVWLRDVVTEQTPQHTNWVEGGDKHVKWNDIREIFSRLDTASGVGSYSRLPQTEHNIHVVDSLSTLPRSKRVV